MIAGLRHPGLRTASRQFAVGLLAAGALLLLSAGRVGAHEECTAAFEKWSKTSAARMRMQKAPGASETASPPPQEACVPSEVVRQGLLLALAKTRTTCDEAPWLDQSAKQTKELIDINASVIGSVGLCRTEESPTRGVEPDPVAPRTALRQRACLDIAQLDADSYVLSNRKCGGSTVLAVIERRGPSGKIDCRGYTVETKLAVATLKDARPQINSECVLEQGSCTRATVASIFPECDW
jgi:hypothetical protein